MLYVCVSLFMNIVLILFECVLECRYHIYKLINPFPAIFFVRKKSVFLFLLHVYKCSQTGFIMAANTMSPDQMAPKKAVLPGFKVFAVYM